MSRKHKKQKLKNTEHRAKGVTRERQVKAIVATDNTFSLHESEWIGSCLHCNSAISVTLSGHTAATIEHIVPLSANGTNDLLNTALACARCNNEKGIRHDPNYPRDPRAYQVIQDLLARRTARWRNPSFNVDNSINVDK